MDIDLVNTTEATSHSFGHTRIDYGHLLSCGGEMLSLPAPSWSVRNRLSFLVHRYVCGRKIIFHTTKKEAQQTAACGPVNFHFRTTRSSNVIDGDGSNTSETAVRHGLMNWLQFCMIYWDIVLALRRVTGTMAGLLS
jgi:hypothetical protein